MTGRWDGGTETDRENVPPPSSPPPEIRRRHTAVKSETSLVCGLLSYGLKCTTRSQSTTLSRVQTRGPESPVSTRSKKRRCEDGFRLNRRCQSLRETRNLLTPSHLVPSFPPTLLTDPPPYPSSVVASTFPADTSSTKLPPFPSLLVSELRTTTRLSDDLILPPLPPRLHSSGLTTPPSRRVSGPHGTPPPIH